MKVRVVTQPTGLLNGREWPVAGEELDLPDEVAKGMAEAGHVEVVKAPAKKVEKRPASKANVETRKG